MNIHGIQKQPIAQMYIQQVAHHTKYTKVKWQKGSQTVEQVYVGKGTRPVYVQQVQGQQLP